MGQTAVGDFGQVHLFVLFTAIRNTAKKQCIPFVKRIKIAADLTQSMSIETLKENIIFKNEDVPGVFLQALLQARHMGLKNTLFLVNRMFCHNDKLDSWQQIRLLQTV